MNAPLPLKEALVKGFTSPFNMAMMSAALGSLLGMSVADLASWQSANAVKNELQKDTVDAEKVVHQYVPNAKIISNKEQLDKIKKNFGLLDRLSLSLAYPNDEYIKKGPAHLIDKNGNEFFIAPKRLNRYAIGHEIGHALDFKEHPYGISDLLKKYILLNTTSREKAAWEKSPIQAKDDELIKSKALGGYETKQQFARGGFLAGGGLYGAYKLGPKILQYLRAA